MTGWHGEAGSWWRHSRPNWAWHALQGFADWELREVITLDGGAPFADTGQSIRLPSLAACKQIAEAIDQARWG